MSQKVLHLTPAYPPSVGGIEDHVATLCCSLANEGNYEPVVVSPRRIEGAAASHEEDFPVYRCRTVGSFRKSVLAPTVAYKAAVVDCDLIHIHAPFHFGLSFGTLAARLRDKPLIVTPHMYAARTDPIYLTYEKLVYDRCLNYANAILPTTESYVDSYDVFQQLDQHIRTVPLSVDHHHYSPATSTRERFGFDKNESIALFVGAMERHHFYKDVELLINAFERCSGVDRLVLGGGGDRVPDLREQVINRGLEDQVDFLGYIPEEDLPALYSAADVFILPSKPDRGEAFGIVLLEAMACGTPVVAADIPGVRDVPREGGMTYKPSDVNSLHHTVEEVLVGDFKPRKTVLENYTVDQMRERIISVYDQVSHSG